MNSTKLYVPTAFDAFDAIGAATSFVAAAIRLDRRGVLGRRRRGRAGVSGAGVASSAHRRDPADGASSVSHTAAAARFSRGGRSGVCGASGAGAVDRTSARRDASSARRLPPVETHGRAMKQRAQRQWSQRRRPRLSTTPQSGQVKRGGAMVFGLYLFQSFVSVAQQNACWRHCSAAGQFQSSRHELPLRVRLLIDARSQLTVAEWLSCDGSADKSGGRAVLRSASLNSFEFRGVFGRRLPHSETVDDRRRGVSGAS